MTSPINSEKIAFCTFTEAILAESGILTIVVLGYHITKSILFKINPKIYDKLAPFRARLSRLSILSQRNKKPEG
jgi:hypothetical protein